MMEVVWLDDATKDLKEIGRFISKENATAAYDVLAKIKASIDSLELNPELGRVGRVNKTRELVIAGLPYIVPYSIHKKQIRILAIMHSAKKWPDDF
jgi:toxin ParE1/3/4